MGVSHHSHNDDGGLQAAEEEMAQIIVTQNQDNLALHSGVTQYDSTGMPVTFPDQSRMMGTDNGDSQLEEGESDFRVPRSPPKKSVSPQKLMKQDGVGPGQYNPSVNITKKKAPVSSWSKYRGKRQSTGGVKS